MKLSKLLFILVILQIFSFFTVKADEIKYAPSFDVNILNYNIPDINKKSCKGSLLSKRWVLTAAHCLLGLEGEYEDREKIKIEVYLDAKKKKSIELEVDLLVPHFNYKDGNFEYDIALIRLNSEAQKHLNHIKFPQIGSDNIDNDLKTNSHRKNDNSISSEAIYKRHSDDQGIIEVESQVKLCVEVQRGGKVFHLGNSSGAALFSIKQKTQEYILHGVHSASVGCSVNSPYYFTQVSKYKLWIELVTQKFKNYKNIDPFLYESN